ncbi:MAG: threonine synthase [Lysobacterales bacterium]|jgi:threonine synthase
MRFISTRGGGAPQTLSKALALGLAEDGGLFVPEAFPSLPTLPQAGLSLAETASALIAPFFAGDALAAELPAICAEALDFPVPVLPTHDPRTEVLELFHGPTAAFKDVGARFLAACFARLPRESSAQPLTILVATSGDTGGAVAAAFHGRPGFRVVVLYPDGRVSPRQAHQLSCFGDNIHTYRVQGSFDDCQRMVKAAFSDPELRAAIPLSSANSISLGRLLPQMSYYAHSALAHQARYGEPARYAIPTGNLGNALACLWARRLGLPIGEVLLATNANRVLPDFIDSGEYRPGPSVSTLANAMDVGAPSNLERLRHWLPEIDGLRAAVSARSIDDARLSKLIREAEAHYGHTLCPHTAAAFAVIEDRRAAGDEGRFIAVATAHPAKFESVVEPLVGHVVPVPSALAALLARPAQAQPLTAEDAALKAALRGIAHA